MGGFIAHLRCGRHERRACCGRYGNVGRILGWRLTGSRRGVCAMGTGWRPRGWRRWTIWVRGGAIFYPYLGSGLGNGALVELADGSVKFDMISGIGVQHWGHSYPVFLDAGIDATLGDTVMQGNLQQNVDAVRLSRELVGLT